MAFELIKKEAWEEFSLKNAINLSYDELQTKVIIPRRSTFKSAGYDFCIPYDMNAEPGNTYIVGTGIKWNPKESSISGFQQKEIRYVYRSRVVLDNVFLALYPRSSYGFKFGFRLLNTTGIIDADYYNNADNDGHIMVGFTVDKPMTLHAGDKFCQGIIQPYAVSVDEIAPTTKRSGGVGSTGK